MNEELILKLLKTDLQISATAYDEYLEEMINLAKTSIETEGIRLEGTREDNMLVEMYAAHLYRKRKENQNEMPRMLRWQLNNKLMSQKAKAGDD